MALSKQNLYSPQLQTISSLAKALSHPARLQILEQLQDQGPLCVQVIAQDHPISLEALSGHFKGLREVHFVEWKEHYPFTFYSVHDKNMEQAAEHLYAFLSQFQNKKHFY